MSAWDVVRKFGGQTPLARELGINQSAIAYWVKEDRIPAKWHAQLLALAVPRGIPLKMAELTGIDAPDNAPVIPKESNSYVNSLPAVTEPTATRQFLFYATPEGAHKVRVILLDETV